MHVFLCGVVRIWYPVDVCGDALFKRTKSDFPEVVSPSDSWK